MIMLMPDNAASADYLVIKADMDAAILSLLTLMSQDGEIAKPVLQRYDHEIAALAVAAFLAEQMAQATTVN